MMFCPNCGNNCGDAKFCSECGFACYKSSEKQPHRADDSFVMPKGRFDVVGGYIELDDKALRIRNMQALFNKEIEIPYDQMTHIAYVRPKKGLMGDGFIILRWKGSKSKKIPVGYARRNDKTTVNFSFPYDPVLYHVFCVLRAVASKQVNSYMEIPKTNTFNIEKQASIKLMDSYFDRFNPDRSRATGQLCSDLGINLVTAAEIIDRVFDTKQQALYTQQPMTAIRDLNRIMMTSAFVSFSPFGE